MDFNDFSKFISTRALQKRSDRRSEPCSQRRASQENAANFHITWRPFFVQKSSLEGNISPQRAHQTAMSQKDNKN
jgi:hypothetical protein